MVSSSRPANGAVLSDSGRAPAGVVDDAIRAVAYREAVVEAGDESVVGEIADVHVDDESLVTVRFAAAVEGYRGWQWSVTVAVIDPAHPTVSEVVLLPGPDALLAPAWVPWKERIRGGDLAPGDLLPIAPDDARIVPAYVQSDDSAVEELAVELGVGRVRVLSREGRDQAALRWHGGAFGPGDEMARLAPGHCVSCAFYLPLAGSLGAGFGVCGNEFSPADGHVVDLGYGCGAHSETAIVPRSLAASADAVIDELRLEVHVRDVEAVGAADDDTADAGLAGVGEPGADAATVDVADADAAADLPGVDGAGAAGADVGGVDAAADLTDADISAGGTAGDDAAGSFEPAGLFDDAGLFETGSVRADVVGEPADPTRTEPASEADGADR